MRTLTKATLCMVGLIAIAAAPLLADNQPWQRPYAGPDAGGESVIALWHFDSDAPARDASGHGHDLTLRGQARFVENGRFGGCLESFAADKEKNGPQGALAKNDPRLTPSGAFTIELWFKAKPEMTESPTAFLLDKKYYHYAKDLPQANRDYCLYLRRAGPNRWRIVAYLGFGKDSAEFASDVVEIVPDRWYHVAFAYDGHGTGRLYLNGQRVGRVVHEGRGPIVAGPYHLAIGDRYGSTYIGFAGYIDEVRISNGVVPCFAGTLELDTAGSRTTFLRKESEASVAVSVFNDTGKTIKGGLLTAELTGSRLEHRLPRLEPRASHCWAVPVDTSLRPDRYPLRLHVAAETADGARLSARTSLDVVIVPRPLPNQMPVVMWGTGDLETVKQIGFTHQLVSLVDYGRVWEAGQPTEAVDSGRLAELAKMLNDYLAQGVGAIANVYPGRWVLRREPLKQKFQRVNREGKPYPREDVCARFPEIQQFCSNVGASVAKTFGRFPAFRAAMIHTEVRDATNVCFHKHDQEAFRAFAGYDIPNQVTSKYGVPYSKIKDFPKDRVVPDDDPILTFYRWFWKEGDGWNELHSRVHRGLKSVGRSDFWTFFDPAVRVPSVWGSGGQVDVLSQWTYSYPDPIKIGQAADELFAMAEGAQPPQRVMKMTQIIWYRSQTAPKLPEDENQRAEWEKQIPDARFITIAPDHLREAFWTKIARPVRGIMYHGWGSLVPVPHGSYRFTNPETRRVLTRLIHEVVRPLGPTLLQVPDRKADMALLESFASQVFAGRGTWGWSHRWEADMHLILQWAHLQPRIIYDETIRRDGLKGYKVLVMPYCDVLTESVCRAVREFQKRGGLVIADETLCPAIQADIVIPSYRRTGKADEDKSALQAKAAELRKHLASHYQPYVDATKADLVVRCRRYGSADYVFVVNDKRTFGRYVGHHGKVMEKGLPEDGTILIRRKAVSVYDLVAHQIVRSVPSPEGTTFDVELGPGGGRVFLVTNQPIDRIR
ncbi:MAG: LamG domain-containing protein, partial [Planctomycetes bacterium]|nr:LamG domain-containing protein [Planctomycetota bacterium]